MAALAWMLGLAASQVHERAVQHVACSEHGETHELGLAQDVEQTVSADGADSEHDHGCLFATIGQPALGSPPLVMPPLPRQAHAGALLASSQAPRGPPLDWAPKTGPPSV